MSIVISAAGLPVAPGGPSPAGTVSETPQPAKIKVKSAFYVDGFNLYHALDELGDDSLKWLDLWALGLSLINRREEELACVKWCTAHYKDDPGKRARHQAYLDALKAVGVTPLLGHFVDEQHTCRVCRGEYWRMSEKQGDVNVAIHLIGDAHEGKYQNYYLVSADSDQVATARYFHELFPNYKLTIVAPPGRRHSQHLLATGAAQKTIFVQTVKACLFGATVPVMGRTSILRPQKYKP